MQIDAIKRIYFIGVGGIGMSALARYFLARNVKVYGYDLTQTSLTKMLETEGIEIHYNDAVDLIPKDIDLVVYTPAIPKDHKEFNWLQNQGLPIVKRAQLLGMLSENMKAIAVAGTHGKTSTSALMAHILKYCGLDTTAFLGGILSGYNSNYIDGSSEYVILEADEYDRSFLHLYPDYLVINSLDADHLDIYGSHAEMISAYEQLTYQVKPGGFVLLMGDFEKLFDRDWRDKLQSKQIRILNFAFDFFSDNMRVESSNFMFDFRSKWNCSNDLISIMPGSHNVQNASAAVMISVLLGLDQQMVRKALVEFKGIKRRFEYLLKEPIVMIDDYAHHPTELKKAVETVNNLYSGKRTLGIFQPHLFSRTKDFYRGFAEELEKLDEIWLLEIYPAREKPLDGVTSALIYNLIRNDNKRLIKSSELLDELLKNKERIEVLVTLGASDIDKYHQKMIEIFKT